MLLSTTKAGFVAPLLPTAKADALATSTVVAPDAVSVPATAVLPLAAVTVNLSVLIATLPEAANVPVTLVLRAREIAPVAVPLTVTVPAPLPSILRFSSVPDDVTTRSAPAAAARPITFNPVAADATDESVCNVGLVAPFGPIARLGLAVEVNAEILAIWRDPYAR